MKKIKMIRVWKSICTITLTAILTIIGVSTSTLDVSAGSNEICIDNSSFAETLDVTKWSNPNQDVVITDGKLVFPAESDEETRLITTNTMKTSESEERLFQADYTLKFRKLPTNKKFVVAFGLDTVESYSEEEGNFEIIFQNDGGIKVSVVVYDDNGEANVLASPQSCGASIGSDVNISMSAAANGEVKIVVNGKNIYQAQSPVELAGRAGFLQSGSCEVEVSSLNLVSYAYDTPENVNIMEDFESGGINVNSLTSRMISTSYRYPSGVYVEEYNGNNVLMFRNVSSSYFGTVHPYSNFEVSFDIPYYQFSDVKREDGTIKAAACGNILLAFGGETADYTQSGYGSAAEVLILWPGSITRYKDEATTVNIANRGFTNSSKNEGYSIKVSVIDTIVTVAVKAINATQYEEVLTYDCGSKTPLGHIQVWTNGKANFAIDNFQVVNKDKVPNLTEVEYKVSKIEGAEDWDYKPQDYPYLQMEEDKKGGISPMVLCGSAVILAVGILVVCYIIGKKRNTPKKKEVHSNEQ